MQKRHAFRPEPLDLLEDRLALSQMATMMPAPAAVHLAAVRTMAAPLADRATVGFEISFLTGMIPHHQMAIGMARLALRYATDPEVKGLARNIIAEQRPEIVRMNRYLAADGVRNYRPEKAADEVADLHSLGSQRGTAFDWAFLTMMIDHHTMAIEGEAMGMAGAIEARTRAAQPGIRSLAANVVATQAREIGEMQSILARLGTAPGMASGMRHGK